MTLAPNDHFGAHRMPTSAETKATISNTTMLAMSFRLAMRSDW